MEKRYIVYENSLKEEFYMGYPLMQAYDSVVVNSDIEMGGTDQTIRKKHSKKF